MTLLRALVLLLCTIAPAMADPLVIFAASSLKEPLDKIAASHGETVVSYGGSGALARQILQGAPADLVVLAHPDWMDELERAGAIVAGSRQNIASNQLVLIGPAGAAPLPLTPQALTDARGDGRLAIGLTNAVPAGQYGRQALMALDLWPAVADHLAEVENVRLALQLVARGEAPLGIVYATDAAADPGVAVLATFPADSHDPIRYPAALIHDTPAARALLDRITGPQGQAILAAAGFGPPS